MRVKLILMADLLSVSVLLEAGNYMIIIEDYKND
jgi:hypothetical protein